MLPLAAAAQQVPGAVLQPAPDRRETHLPDFADPPDRAPTLQAPASPVPPSDVQGTIVLTGVVAAGDTVPASIAWPEYRDEVSGLVVSLNEGEALGPEWLRRQFEANGLIGKPVELSRVVNFIQILNQRFVASGFVNSGVLVPPQPVIEGEGVLQLELVLGRITGESAIVVSPPAKGLAQSYIERRLPSAKAIPFNAAAFEREFRLLAEDDAIATINADLAPTGRAGEATLAVAAVPVDRFDLYTSFANNRSPAIGGERFAVGGSARNVLASGDLLFAEFGTNSGVDDATLGYSIPLNPDLRVFAFGFINDAFVIDPVLRPLDIRTRSQAVDAGIERALIVVRSRTTGKSGSAIIDQSIKSLSDRLN